MIFPGPTISLTTVGTPTTVTTTTGLSMPQAIMNEGQQQLATAVATSGSFFGSGGGLQTSLLGVAAPGVTPDSLQSTKTALKKLAIAGFLSLIPTLAIFMPFLLAALKRRRERIERRKELAVELNHFRHKRLLWMNHRRHLRQYHPFPSSTYF